MSQVLSAPFAIRLGVRSAYSLNARATISAAVAASLIMFGEKDVENRTWTTRYRGSLAIHAGLGVDHDVELWQREIVERLHILPGRRHHRHRRVERRCVRLTQSVGGAGLLPLAVDEPAPNRTYSDARELGSGRPTSRSLASRLSCGLKPLTLRAHAEAQRRG